MCAVCSPLDVPAEAIQDFSDAIEVEPRYAGAPPLSSFAVDGACRAVLAPGSFGGRLPVLAAAATESAGAPSLLLTSLSGQSTLPQWRDLQACLPRRPLSL